MFLQLALDTISIEDAKSLIHQVKDVIDIVEVGTPFIIQDGVGAVRKLKRSFPALRILADVKIVDGAEYESKLAFEAGADIVTVLAISDDATINAAVQKAQEYGKSVMVDMITIKDVVKRAVEIDQMGVDYICVHTASDVKQKEAPPLEELKKIKKALMNAQIAIAGGIDDHFAEAIVKEKPEIIIVGSYITKSPNPREAALTLKNIMPSD